MTPMNWSPAFGASFFDFPPYRLSGVVYGTLMNHAPALAALGNAASAPPYKAPPQAPVLYIKPRNTLNHDGAMICLPQDVQALEVGAALGLVIGKPACRLTRENALDHLAGYTVVNDISVPHSSFYRPAIQFKAHDGFCPLSQRVTAAQEVKDPNHLKVKVWMDGALVHETTTHHRVRDVQQLMVDVTEFMTLQPGDVLMIGVSAGAPLVKAGQLVEIEIEQVGRLQNTFGKALNDASGVTP